MQSDMDIETEINDLIEEGIAHEVKFLEAPKFIKDDKGKARFDLIPPEFLFEMARTLAYGANKYSDNNWARGANWSRYFSAMQRHLWAWFNGEELDEESGHTHLAHAACCLAFLMSYQYRGLGKDDRFYTVSENADHQ
jgi:hypothetical protein